MCRIKFKETFRMNVGLSDLSKKKFFLSKVRFFSNNFSKKGQGSTSIQKVS